MLAYRIVALAGLAMIVWALPRLARPVAPTPTGRCAGGGRPLVLLHVVGGAHNDGLWRPLVALEIGLAGVAPGAMAS